MSAAAPNARGSPSTPNIIPLGSLRIMIVSVSARKSLAIAMTCLPALSNSQCWCCRELSVASLTGGNACRRAGSTCTARQRRQESSIRQRNALAWGACPLRNPSHAAMIFTLFWGLDSRWYCSLAIMLSPTGYSPYSHRARLLTWLRFAGGLFLAKILTGCSDYTPLICTEIRRWCLLGHFGSQPKLTRQTLLGQRERAALI